MEVKATRLIIKGMYQDWTISKFNPEYTYENKNIRITTQEHDTLLTVENEKGNLEISFQGNSIHGYTIGYATLNEYIILFTKDTLTGVDRIYRITSFGDLFLMYEGNLNFNIDKPIQPISYYENESIQKVYWVDGINPIRFLNIKKEDYQEYDNDIFDFLQGFEFTGKLNVEKYQSGGTFTPGTIQYCFTYYNLFGAETAIAAITPLYYISTIDRGLSPEQLSTNSFKITASDIDTSFDYIRCYAIQHTSLNTTPIVRIISDYPITDTIKESGIIQVIDDGIIGSTTSLDALLSLGTSSIIPETITTKDNTLFAANITLPNSSLLIDYTELDSLLNDSDNINKVEWVLRDTTTTIENNSNNALYPYLPYSLNYSSQDIKHFKKDQIYRLGLQFQYKTGEWSIPIRLHDANNNDITCTVPYYTKFDEDNKKVELYYNKAIYNIPSSVLEILYQNGYRRARPVYVPPTMTDRTVLCQGVLTNTIAISNLRGSNNAFAYPDYLTRLNRLNRNYNESSVDTVFAIGSYLDYAEFGHFFTTFREVDSQHISYSVYSENSAKSYRTVRIDSDFTPNETRFQFNEFPFIFMDENIVNLWSPELEFNESLGNYFDSTTQCHIIGMANFTNTIENVTTSSTIDGNLSNISLNNRFLLSTYYRSSETNSNRLIFDYYKAASVNNAGTTKHKSIWKNEFSYKEDPNIDPDPFYTTDGDYDFTVKNTVSTNTLGYKYYSLYNTLFRSDLNLQLPINPPQQVLGTEDLSTVPYNTNIEDYNGTVNYGKNLNYLVLHREGPSAFQMLGTLIKYKSNSHAVLSLKNITYTGNGIPQVLTNVLPGIATVQEEPSETKVTINWSTLPVITEDIIISPWESVTKYICPIVLNVINQETMSVGDVLTFDGYIHLSYWVNEQGGDTKFEINKTIWVQTNDEFYGENSEEAKLTITNDTVIPGGGLVGYLVYQPTERGTVLEDMNLVSFYCDPPSNTSDYIFQNSITSGSLQVYNSPYYRDITPLGFVKNTWDIDKLLDQDQLDKNDTFLHPYLLLAELRRTVNLDSIYGGRTESAFLNNNWVPCGPEIIINNDYTADPIEFLEGDTYLQRYDALRIFPENTTDFQRLNNITSFLCETYINLDGKYDRNRYNPDARNKNLENFNLVNEVYSQVNNTFLYKKLDPNLFSNIKFPNQVVWSSSKYNGEKIDPWTKLSPVSSIYLDGVLGPINGIINFNNEVIGFQDKGVSHILFNSRVQIPTSDNFPIELTNNYKVSGYRYISTISGCLNKFSIQSTQSGLYFIDSVNKDINVFNGESITDLSTKVGMKNWSNNHIEYIREFSPTNMNNLFTINVDRTKDFFFLTNNEFSLGFAENLGLFSSFYSYENTPFMFNSQDKFIALRNFNNKTTVWNQNSGEYNSFFGTKQPSYIHYKINPDSYIDKTFNNLEFRADTFDAITEEFIPTRTFDKLRVWNEYQDTEVVTLSPNINLLRKFRMWRTPIPRQVGTLNRIRNPWVNLKLIYTPELYENNRINLHDILMYYTQ